MGGASEKPRSFTVWVAPVVVLGFGSVGPAAMADVASTAAGSMADADTPHTALAGTSTAITSSPNPAAVGSPITLTAEVSPMPTGGTVSFTDNVAPIAACESLPLTGASATCAVSYPDTGSHTFVASYSGTAGFAASESPALSQVVTSIQCRSLSGCNLSRTDATGVGLPGANLSRANLSGAYLTRANLTGANLAGANLKNANLNSTDLTRATLTGAATTGATFKDAVWSNTICPDGTNSDSHDNTCGGHL
jgi:Bacterial Ig-like domain (group 3)/Pentapeptide repeats (8 copies)